MFFFCNFLGETMKHNGFWGVPDVQNDQLDETWPIWRTILYDLTITITITIIIIISSSRVAFSNKPNRTIIQMKHPEPVNPTSHLNFAKLHQHPLAAPLSGMFQSWKPRRPPQVWWKTMIHFLNPNWVLQEVQYPSFYFPQLFCRQMCVNCMIVRFWNATII